MATPDDEAALEQSAGSLDELMVDDPVELKNDAQL